MIEDSFSEEDTEDNFGVETGHDLVYRLRDAALVAIAEIYPYLPELHPCSIRVFLALHYLTLMRATTWVQLSTRELAEETEQTQVSVIKGIGQLRDLGILSVAEFYNTSVANAYSLFPWLCDSEELSRSGDESYLSIDWAQGLDDLLKAREEGAK